MKDRHERSPSLRDDAAVLLACGSYLCSLVLRALLAAPGRAATYAHVANQMLSLAQADGKTAYLDFIRNSFTVREVLGAQHEQDSDQPAGFAAGAADDEDAVQDRRACCGTMNNAQYNASEQAFDDECAALAAWCRDYGPRD